MITNVVKGKHKYSVVSQQYIVGLYVAIYRDGRILDQLSLDTQDEAAFHNEVRAKKFFKGRHQIIK